jgi:hypothetical protein
LFGLGYPVLAEEQLGELECGVNDAAIDGKAIRRLSALGVTAIRKQYPQVVSSGAVTILGGMGKPLLGLGQLVLTHESFAELECGFGGARPRRRYVISHVASCPIERCLNAARWSRNAHRTDTALTGSPARGEKALALRTIGSGSLVQSGGK